MIFSKLLKRVKRVNPKQLVVAVGFMAAMTAAIGFGLATKQFSQAATTRECDNNAILKCGALSASEFINDVKSNNNGTQSDLKTIYANSTVSGLASNEYDRFKDTARMGKVYRDGRVVVDGQTVMTGAKSLGRQKFNSARQPITIGSKTYYYSATDRSFADGVTALDAMVMFDANGLVETVIMTSCGNPVWGTKIKPEYSCKTLNQRAVAGQENTYEFNTTVGPLKNTTVNRVEYNFGDGSPVVTKTNPSEYVSHTFTKSAEVTVTVYFNIPGKKVVAAPMVVTCKKKITVTPPPTPFYSCTEVIPTAINNEKTKFRFTVKTSQGNGATLKDADFTLNGTSTVTGVVAKDAQGNIYREYEFAQDGKEHTILVKVNFNIASGVQSKTCEAKVTSGKTPECKPGVPVGHPDCEPKVEECKPGVPVGSPECEEKCPHNPELPKDSDQCVPPTPPAELPKTGMGSVLGLFAGTTIAGAVGHRIVASRRK
jgi:hypothetical protein